MRLAKPSRSTGNKTTLTALQPNASLTNVGQSNWMTHLLFNPTSWLPPLATPRLSNRSNSGFYDWISHDVTRSKPRIRNLDEIQRTIVLDKLSTLRIVVLRPVNRITGMSDAWDLAQRAQYSALPLVMRRRISACSVAHIKP